MRNPLDPAANQSISDTKAIQWPVEASLDQLCDWLDNGIRLGDTLRCEQLLEQFPHWRADPEAVLDLIYTEYNARCETGSTPSQQEYFDRFPQWRQQLEHQFQLANLFDSPASIDNLNTAQPLDSPPAATVAPRYRIVKLLARGGIGQVMHAIDTELNREVAVKEIQTQLVENIAIRERFLREAEITGQLEHPGIVPVYGLGSDELNRPFYAMRLVRGQSLLEALQDFHRAASAGAFRSLRFQNLLRRFLSVCETISYAHSRGVIHRDIKPENILLGPFGETLVVDWGLAKVTQVSSLTEPANRNESSKSMHQLDGPAPVESSDRFGGPLGNSPANWSVELTQSAGALVGTPAYMSPEQAQGDSASISTACDVYSLGATLHMLLTGLPRFSTQDLGSALRAILNDDLPSPRMQNRRVPKGLDAICLKALRLKPEDRYASAAQMARDIEHYLADEPTSALRESTIAHLMRLTRRHRSLAFSAIVSMMILTAVTVVAAVQINRERQQADAAFVAAERGNARLAFDRGYQLLETHQFGEGLLWLQRALTHLSSDDRSMRRVILTNMAAASSHLLVRQAMFDNQQSLALFEFDAEGRNLMTIDRTGLVRYWNADNGETLVEHQLPTSRVLAANIDAQGFTRVATATGRNLSFHALSNTQSPTKIWSADQPGYIHHVTFSPNGSLAAACLESDDQWSIRVFNALDGQLLATIPTTTQAQLVFDQTRSLLICIDQYHLAKFWKWYPDKQAYEVVGELANVQRLTLSADGKWVLVATEQGSVSCYSADTLKLKNDTGQHLGSVVALAVSPDSQVLVAVWNNGVARSWTLQDLRPACETLRVDRYTTRVLFRPHTRQLALLAKPHIVTIWQLPVDRQTSLPLPVRNLDTIEYSRDGTQAIGASRNRYAYLMNGSTGKTIGAPMRHTDVIKTACLHPDGRIALTASYDGSAVLWNTASGAKADIQLIDPNTTKTVRLNGAAFSPDGRWIATLENFGPIKLWDASTGALLRTMQAPNSSAIKACFSPCSRTLLVGYNTTDCGVRMWEVETGQLLWTGKHAGAVRCVAISPDGKVAVSGGNDATAKLWDTASGEAIGRELPGRGEIFAARFHPNSSMVATGGYDATIRLWAVPSGELIGEPMLHQALVTDFVFSLDGTRLLSGATDATARLWDVNTCLPLSPPLPHDSEILSVALHPAKDIALTGRLWHLPTPLPDEPELLNLWTRLATQRMFVAGNNVQWLTPEDLKNDAAMFEARAGRSWNHWPDQPRISR